MNANRLISISRPVIGLCADAVFRIMHGQARVYWRAPQSNQVVTGFGSAADLRAWGRNRYKDIERQARQLFRDAVVTGDAQAAPRLFGGFAFRDDFLPDYTWSVFHPAQFVLPHFQLVEQPTPDAADARPAWLTMNVLVGRDDDVDELLPALQTALDARYEWLVSRASKLVDIPVDNPTHALHSSVATEVRHLISPAQWASLIDTAHTYMQAGRMTKVVLARACELRSDTAINVEVALARLNRRYPDCYRFVFEPQVGHVFLGATPELLVNVHGKDLRTMALAGSIQRGRDASEDAQLGQALLSSEKDRYEHDIVVQSLRARLGPITQSLSVPDTPVVMPLSNIQHLHTPIQATLKRRITAFALAAQLHPTPALGGQPQQAAMDFIRDFEPVPRGWYAAPFGWVDAKLDGEFVVAIRSAVTHDTEAWLYAGAGIVQASVAQQEWDETALKFRPMMEALATD